MRTIRIMLLCAFTLVTFDPGKTLGEAAPPPGRAAGEVSAEGGSGRPWIVYVEKAPAPGVVPPGATARLEQRNAQFVPNSLVVVQGQTVDFPNSDKFFHNVYSVTPGNEFDLGLFRGGLSKPNRLITTGEVDVYCNIHPNMSAKILVLQNNFYAEVALDGSFVVPNIPPGQYTLVAWSAGHEPRRQSIEIRSGSTARASFALKLRKAAISHLNKNGEQYGRYK